MKNVLNCIGHPLKIPNVVDSAGVYLFDENGKRYMDLESGVWCMALGHRNERINGIIKRQVDAVLHAGFCYSSKILDEAAGSILSITDLAGGKCVFLSSGSEAVEVLRQIAKKITGKQKTLALHDAYLGSYSSVINRDVGWHSFNWERCQTCSKKDECDPDCEALREIPDDISEFAFEPGSASGFVRFPPKALIRNMVDVVRKNGGVILANEVTTGIGRTGKWFGYQHYDIEPDMVSIGKGVGNGYPVSVAVLSRATAKKLEKVPFKYSQSHQNDPLGAAIVREVIQTIEEDDLIAKAKKNGEAFHSQLKSLIDGEIIRDVRGRGLMLAADLASKQVGDEMYDELIEQGYIVGNRGSLFRMDPPLTISKKELGEFINAFAAVVAAKKNTA